MSDSSDNAKSGSTQRETFESVVRALDSAGIPYMLTGSIASSFHGEPRATLDIDVVVDPTETNLGRLVDELQALGYYAERDAAYQALSERGQFNAIDPASGWKVDLIVRPRGPFSDSAFSRRIHASILGVDVHVATAEDTIISKLEWAGAGESDRQLRDVAGILLVSGETLDLDYVTRWVRQLGLEAPWTRAFSKAGRA